LRDVGLRRKREASSQNGRMLSADTAAALADAGILWEPQPGDRFAISSAELTGDLFWISDLTIEVHHYQDETVLGFNGTTEWALDSVPLDKAVWLPREDQLRELIGDRLVALQREREGWSVRYVHSVGGAEAVALHTDPEEAYAAALLAIAGGLP